MKLIFTNILLLQFLIISQCFGYGKMGRDSVDLGNNGYYNPVIDKNTPDPTIIKAPDGNYYLYAT